MNGFILSFENREGITRLAFKTDSNQRGILNKLATVVFSNGWDGISAGIEKAAESNTGFIDIEHVLAEKFNQGLCEKIQSETLALLHRQISCIDYLEETFAGLDIFSNDSFKVSSAEKGQVRITADSAPGAMIKITYQLDALDVDILSFEVEQTSSQLSTLLNVTWQDGATINDDDLEFLESLLNKSLSNQ